MHKEEEDEPVEEEEEDEPVEEEEQEEEPVEEEEEDIIEPANLIGNKIDFQKKLKVIHIIEQNYMDSLHILV